MVKRKAVQSRLSTARDSAGPSARAAKDNGQINSAADVICVRKYHDDDGDGGGDDDDHDIYRHPFFTVPIASGAPADLGDGMSAAPWFVGQKLTDKLVKIIDQ